MRRTAPASERGDGPAPSGASGSPSSTECVDGDGTTRGVDDHRVQVDAGDVGPLPRQPAEPDQQLDQRATVDRGFAPELAQQLLGGQAVDHLVGRDLVERGRAEHHIGHRLGQDPADAQHHRRPELLVPQQPGDQLAIAPDHRGDQHGDLAVFGGRLAEQLLGGTPNGGGVAQAQPHESTLGLVGDGVAVELGHDRVAELVGRRRRRPSTVGTTRSPAIGTPYPASSSLDADSDNVRADITASPYRRNESESDSTPHVAWNPVAPDECQGSRAARKNATT